MRCIAACNCKDAEGLCISKCQIAVCRVYAKVCTGVLQSVATVAPMGVQRRKESPVQRTEAAAECTEVHTFGL